MMANEVVENKAKKLKDTVKEAASSFDTKKIEETANKAATDLQNSIETKAGSIAGQIEGGVKQITQKFDAFQDKLNNTTVEGLIDDGVQSLENMATDFVNDQISNLASKLGLGAKVEIQFTEPDSSGMIYPIASSLEEEGGVSGTVAAILQLITGLGVGPGSLQQIVTDASAEGLLKAGKDLVEGKIGAFTSEGISNLAGEAINSVVNEFETTVKDAITTGTIGSINATIEAVSGVGIDGLGNQTVTRTSITGSMADALTEVNSAIDKIKTNPLKDLKEIVTTAKEVKQNLEGAKSDLENLTGKNGAEVLSSVQSSSRSRSQYNRITDEKRTLVRTRIAKNSGLGIIQALSSEVLTDVVQRVRDFCKPTVISFDRAQNIVTLSQGDSRDFNNAVKDLESITGKSYNIIKTFLNGIDTTITNATLQPPSETVFSEPYVIGSYEKNWENGLGDPIFPYISSTEELQAELTKVTREVTEVVVHWTETATNKNIGSEEINKYHLELGLDGIGYHYIIRRDGSLQKGRPLNIEGQHADVNGHNSRSIGIAFVGGINVPSGTPNIDDFVSVQSLTRSQLNTFDHFCRAFFSIFQGGQMLGHNDIDSFEEDPGFDVREYVRFKFGKESLFDDPENQSPFTKEQIIKGGVE